MFSLSRCLFRRLLIFVIFLGSSPSRKLGECYRLRFMHVINVWIRWLGS
ncbi:hypothetical protein F383_08280 [Gossypium arboreum]|uniref:Uncharacterized protein n=1 Tax=Gossypium arboreum TaxID=29729 RepID=A0A0B0NE17_GOSAR|nr:hypothetical protein F383_08280 [Gossypium arboreum]